MTYWVKASMNLMLFNTCYHTDLRTSAPIYSLPSVFPALSTSSKAQTNLANKTEEKVGVSAVLLCMFLIMSYISFS